MTPWPKLLSEMNLKDLFDLVTVTHDYLKQTHAGAAQRWLLDIRKIFLQEHVQYRVEPGGGVRFAFDESFAQVRAAAIAALSAPRYANSLAEFEKGMVAFGAAQPDGKSSVRATFTAVEGLFAQCFPRYDD